jgi:hypothetical protein
MTRFVISSIRFTHHNYDSERPAHSAAPFLTVIVIRGAARPIHGPSIGHTSTTLRATAQGVCETISIASQSPIRNLLSNTSML